MFSSLLWIDGSKPLTTSEIFLMVLYGLTICFADNCATEGRTPSQRQWKSELSILSFSDTYQTGEALYEEALDEVSHHRTYSKKTKIYYLVEIHSLFQHVALQREICISCACDLGDVTSRDFLRP